MSLRKIWNFLFSNYMWLYLIYGVCTVFLGLNPMTFQLLMGVSFLFLLSILRKVKIQNGLDLSVVFFLLWIFLNSITIDYSNHFDLWIDAFVMHICPICFFFLAKSVDCDIEVIIKKAIIPMIIAMVCGLLFYYIEPGWYTALKMRQLLARSADGKILDEQLIEYFRLSSFWATPYVIGYASMVFADYNLHMIFSNNSKNAKKQNRLYFMLLILSVVVMLLTQFRATIYMLVLTIFYLLFLGKNKIKLSYIFVIVCSGGLMLSTLLDKSTETGAHFRERMLYGLDRENVESRLEVTGGGVDLMTIAGNGYGRYGSSAKSLNNEFPMVDSEYQRVLAELGIIGFLLLMGVVVSGLVMSFRKKRLQLEFIIVLFYSGASLTSSCLSVMTTLPFIFWYALGRISLKSRKCTN